MHKRYGIKFGRLQTWDVVAETAKQFTSQHTDTYGGGIVQQRRSKEGTFLTIREALENELTALMRQKDQQSSALQKTRSRIGELESLMTKSDEQIERAIGDEKRF